jgi:hypothetical protein
MLWGMICFNLFGLAMFGYFLWSGTGERAVIFHGWNNFGTDIIRARAVSGFISMMLILIAFNIQILSGYEIYDQRLVFGIAFAIGMLYYLWRRAVAIKREKERLARNLKPSDHA